MAFSLVDLKVFRESSIYAVSCDVCLNELRAKYRMCRKEGFRGITKRSHENISGKDFGEK